MRGMVGEWGEGVMSVGARSRATGVARFGAPFSGMSDTRRLHFRDNGPVDGI